MRGKTIGIIGGGQLGRMLTLAAKPLGFDVVVINPSANSPAAQVGAQEIVADLYDQKALEQLSSMVDFLTVEIEHLDAEVLEKLSTKKSINPAPATIRLIQDKLEQKRFLAKHNIPIADFRSVTDQASAAKALSDFGGKMLLKARHGAYDGRGNRVVNSLKDIDAAFKVFDGRDLYAETYVPFVKELAVVVARDLCGQTATYPVVETIHQRNICLEVLSPASIKPAQREQAEELATKVVNLLDGAGVFAIEMFLTVDGHILVNEIAPRVHNSGHLTLEANRTSQFEQHVRAITGLPLGNTEMIMPAAVMINILGEHDGPTKLTGIENALANPDVSVHIYGKSPTKVDRKMGHLTAIGQTAKSARKKAREARKLINV